MDLKLEKFLSLSNMFKEHGFSLYLVGGTVRDYLLNKPLSDMDAVTDATPDDMKEFLEDADYTFSRMGSVKYKHEGVKFDITTLREEKNYVDSRHPTEVIFVKDLSKDVIRRDFTVNGMYLDESLNVIDYVNGQQDLKNKTLKIIGDPDKRIKEDPLRIVRAVRFAISLGFVFDKDLEESLLRNQNLLKKLRKEKIQMDLNKLKEVGFTGENELFNKFGISRYLNMIE